MAEAGKEIDRVEARQLIEDGAQLVDVRADHEWEAGRIAGATHLPLAELAERAGEIDRERPVVLYCRGGNRSTMAAAALAALVPGLPGLWLEGAALILPPYCAGCALGALGRRLVARR